MYNLKGDLILHENFFTEISLFLETALIKYTRDNCCQLLNIHIALNMIIRVDNLSKKAVLILLLKGHHED